MEKNKTEKNKYRILMEEHPLLFARRKLPMSQTCMCWGIEAGPGWYEPLRTLCDHLEAINLTEGKQFGLVVRAEQVKEKFGTLRFYYNIEVQSPIWRKILAFPFNLLARLFNTKFEPEKVNIEKDEEGEVKHYDIVWHPRFIYWLRRLFCRISTWIEFPPESDHRLAVMTSTIQDIVDHLIAKAEAECMNYCEDCGRQIGEEWSPRCETTGWITYLCERCIKEKHSTEIYIKHLPTGDRYFQGDKDVTEEVEKERAAKRKAKAKKSSGSEQETAKKKAEPKKKATTPKARKSKKVAEMEVKVESAVTEEDETGTSQNPIA